MIGTLWAWVIVLDIQNYDYWVCFVLGALFQCYRTNQSHYGLYFWFASENGIFRLTKSLERLKRLSFSLQRPILNIFPSFNRNEHSLKFPFHVETLVIRSLISTKLLLFWWQHLSKVFYGFAGNSRRCSFLFCVLLCPHLRFRTKSKKYVSWQRCSKSLFSI